MDQILHKLMRYNYEFYLRKTKNNKQNNPLINKLFDTYISKGYNNNHANFLKQNLEDITLQVARKFIELTGTTMIEMTQQPNGMLKLARLETCIKYIFGVELLTLPLLKLTPDELKYIQNHYGRLSNSACNELVQNKLIKYLSDIFNESNTHHMGNKDNVVESNINDVISKIGHQINHPIIKKCSNLGAHSLIYKLNNKSSSNLIAKIILTGHKSKEGIEGVIGIKRDSNHLFHEYTELIINILLSIYIKDNVNTINHLHLIRYTTTQHPQTNNIILISVCNKLPYLLTHVFDNYNNIDQKMFNNIAHKIIEISHNIYHKFGIIHGDLKPDNIMIDTCDLKKINNNNFNVYFIDFGLSYFNLPIHISNIKNLYLSDSTSGYDICFFFLICVKYFKVNPRKRRLKISDYCNPWIESWIILVILHLYVDYYIPEQLIHQIYNNEKPTKYKSKNIIANNRKLIIDKIIRNEIHITDIISIIVPTLSKHKKDVYMFHRENIIKNGLSISIDLWKHISNT